MLYKIIKTYWFNEVNVFVILIFILASLYFNFFLPYLYSSEFIIAIDSFDSQNASSALTERKINASFLAEIVNSPTFYKKNGLNQAINLKVIINEHTGSIKFRVDGYNREQLIKDIYRLFLLFNSKISMFLKYSKPVDVIVLQEPYLESYIPFNRIILSVIIGFMAGAIALSATNILFKTKKDKIGPLPAPPSNLPIIS